MRVAGRHHPRSHEFLAARRYRPRRIAGDLTLHQMLEEGYIQKEDYLRYVKMPVHVQPAKPSNIQSYVMAEAVKEMEQILSIEGTEEMPQGLTVRTNIDLHIQHAVEDQVNKQLAELETSATPADNGPAQAKPPLQGAAIVADVASWARLRLGGRKGLSPRASTIMSSMWSAVRMACLLKPLMDALGF